MQNNVNIIPPTAHLKMVNMVIFVYFTITEIKKKMRLPLTHLGE